MTKTGDITYKICKENMDINDILLINEDIKENLVYLIE